MLSKAGEGAFGVVMKAREVMSGRIVAIKTVACAMAVEHERQLPIAPLREYLCLSVFISSKNRKNHLHTTQYNTTQSTFTTTV